MLILVSVGIYFGRQAIDRARLEDIKTEMITIKTRAKIIVDEYNYKDIEELPGIPTTQEDLTKLNLNGENYYTWDDEALLEQGLNKIDPDKYVVYYNLKNPNDCEVYYLEGFDGKHSLTELQGEE